MVLGCYQCQGVLLIWVMVGLGSTVLSEGTGGNCLGISLSPIILIFFFLLSVTAQYILRTVSNVR